MRPLVIAHRGASGREVENSLAAFRLAADMGADGVELDVHATSDGRLVVFHDETVGRMRIASSTFEQIRTHRLGNGETVPSLEEALGVILPGMKAYIEVKTLEPGFDSVLLDIIDTSAAPASTAVHSFDHRIVRRLHGRRPRLALGILLAEYLFEPAAEMKASCAKVVWQSFQYIDRALVQSIRDAGGAVYAWTVDDRMVMERLASLGVAGLCSNHPDRARAFVDSRLS